INGKLLVGLLAAAILIGAGVPFLHRFQSRRGTARLLKRVELAEAQGRPDRALAFLDRYLNVKPGDTTALARYGLILERSAATPESRVKALLVVELVLRRDPGRADVRRRLDHLA